MFSKFKYPNFLVSRFTVFLMICNQGVMAQSPSDASSVPLDEEGKPQAYLSLIAIGPQAKRRYRAMTSEERKNLSGSEAGGAELSAEELKSLKGLPVLMPPKEGELPPSSLKFADGKTATADGKSVDNIVHIPVGFNTSSSFSLVPAGKPLALKAPVFKRKKEGVDSWFTVEPLQPGATKLVLMYPGSTSDQRWHFKPKYRVLNADAKSFPNNRVLAINLTRRQVKVMIGKDGQVLRPGGAHNYTVPNARRLIPCVAAAQGYDKGYILNSGFRGDLPIRKIYIFHETENADGQSSEIKAIQVNLPDVDTALSKAP